MAQYLSVLCSNNTYQLHVKHNMQDSICDDSTLYFLDSRYLSDLHLLLDRHTNSQKIIQCARAACLQDPNRTYQSICSRTKACFIQSHQEFEETPWQDMAFRAVHVVLLMKRDGSSLMLMHGYKINRFSKLGTAAPWYVSGLLQNVSTSEFVELISNKAFKKMKIITYMYVRTTRVGFFDSDLHVNCKHW